MATQAGLQSRGMTRALASLLALGLAACATRTAPHDETARRLAMFEAVVFAQEYDQAPTRFLAKWTGPLRIALKGKTNAAHRRSVEAHARLLGQLTGLDIAMAPAGKRANVIIHFASLDDMEHLAGPRIRNRKQVTDILLTSGCLFFYDKDARHRITGASIFVRTGRMANDIHACLLEEMTQILGLPNDSDLIKPSIFNSGDARPELTALDRAFVRALYDPKMPAGTPRPEALMTADALLRTHRP